MSATNTALAAADPLAINSVKVQDGTRFLASGGTQRVTTVTYWLGKHGPFELVYPQGTATAVQINNDIAARKNQLSQVMGTVPGS